MATHQVSVLSSVVPRSDVKASHRVYRPLYWHHLPENILLDLCTDHTKKSMHSLCQDEASLLKD